MTTADEIWNWYWRTPGAAFEECIRRLDAANAPVTKPSTTVPPPVIWWLEVANRMDAWRAQQAKKVA